MTLTDILEGQFRADVRFRGVAYLEAERIAITRVTADQVFALVRDGVEYQTQLTRKEGQLLMYCNCAGGKQSESTCKHLWATVLSVDAGGYLAGTPKPGYVPPFVIEQDEPDFSMTDWDDEISGFEEGSRSQTSIKSRRAAMNIAPKLREWETRLQDVRQEMETGKIASQTHSREREIFYEIDVQESWDAQQLVVQTSQRQRRANGQWGKLKPLKLRPGNFQEIEQYQDRRILAYLSGSTPERTNWHAQQAEVQTSIYRYRVPYELCELILPMMCESGRVRYTETSLKSATSLEWDTGDAWELCMKVALDDAGENWVLDGKLQRGEESLPLSDARLLVPGGLVLTDSTISRAKDSGAFSWVQILSGKESLQVPNGEEHEFVDSLLGMPQLPRLELPEELALEEVRCEPVPRLVLTSPRASRWSRDRLVGEIYFDYDGHMVPGASTQWAVVRREENQCLLRDQPQEDAAWAQLEDCGFRRQLGQNRGGHDVEIGIRELGPSVRRLFEHGWQIRADGKQVHQPAEMQFRIQSGIDWFELHADIDFEGRSVAFPELLSALARGDSTIRLDDDSWGIIPEEWAKEYGLLAGLGEAEEGHLRFNNDQVGLLDALLSAKGTVDYDDRFREVLDRLKNFSGVLPETEPEGFVGELRHYQREGLGWLEFLQEFRFGGCLADDMGLGKTVQLLALLQQRKIDRKKLVPSLIVVPKSLLFNWHQECERFTPDLKVLEYSGLDRATFRAEISNFDVVLTTYGTLRRDIVHLKDIQFDYIVLDEAQMIKNASSQVAKASRLLKSEYRLALSGTPVENHLGDLWSIFEFLNPGMLGRSSVFKTFAADTEDDESRMLLARGLKPFIFRRTKKEVASELPEKIEQTIYCDMGEKQAKLYEELKGHYRDSLLGLVQEQGLGKSKIHVLEALLRLRQAACHPALLDKSAPDEPSAKLDVLVPYLEELIEEGHKSLVFSQFTSMLSIVKHHLDKRGIRYEYLDGQTRNRKEVVENFQNDPDCRVFLISLKAGGLGLNLTAAEYVFLLDPWWNPAVETQAIDRAHRVGQSRRVFAYRLICRNTVEEKITDLQSKKRKLADAILEENNQVLKDLSSEDLELLLS